MQELLRASLKRRLRPCLDSGSVAPRLVSWSENESGSKREVRLFLRRTVLCGDLADLPQEGEQAASCTCRSMSRTLAGQGP